MATLSERLPTDAALPTTSRRPAALTATEENRPAVALPTWRWRAVDDPPPVKPPTTRQRLLSWLIRYNEY